MEKSLEKMTLEELWELFPISLSQYSVEWKQWASEEIELISRLLSVFSPIVSHIGSTAIGGICSKPIVDILVEVPKQVIFDEIRSVLERVGYICMSIIDKRVSFNKGYTHSGYAERVFHIHVRRYGDNDEIYFRDYLRLHPDVAREYEALKLSLVPKYIHNRDGYTEAKSKFVKGITSIAKASQSVY